MSAIADRVGVISLQRRIEDPMGMDFGSLRGAVGLNTGNLMFTNAVYKQIDGELERIGFDFDPEEVNKRFDALVIPAANWINHSSDWSGLIAVLERVSVPIIVVGVGVQADSMDLTSVKVNASSRKLIQLISERSSMISCRGDFTRDWLYSIGIKNAVSTGCPSLYMRFPVYMEQASENGTVILQGTRHGTSPAFLSSNGINRELYRLAGNLELPMIYQSEADEMEFLYIKEKLGSVPEDDKLRVLAEVYGFQELSRAKSYLAEFGRVFYNLDDWSKYIQRNLGVLGTRLHGAIIALNSNRPARLLAHDSRTKEIADFAGIPVLKESDLINKTASELRYLLSEVDVNGFLAKRKSNSELYIDFLKANGLRPRYSEIATE